LKTIGDTWVSYNLRSFDSWEDCRTSNLGSTRLYLHVYMTWFCDLILSVGERADVSMVYCGCKISWCATSSIWQWFCDLILSVGERADVSMVYCGCKISWCATSPSSHAMIVIKFFSLLTMKTRPCKIHVVSVHLSTKCMYNSEPVERFFK
jgi:hypothetical protein